MQPNRGDRTVIFSLEDGPATLDNQLYMYVGKKDHSATASVLARNGLDNGKLFLFRSLDPGRNSERTFTSGSVTGEWVEIPKAENLTDAELEAASDAAGATTFVRPEDGAYNPNNRNEFFFVTTGSSSGADEGVNELGRLYSLALHPGNRTSESQVSTPKRWDVSMMPLVSQTPGPTATPSRPGESSWATRVAVEGTLADHAAGSEHRRGRPVLPHAAGRLASPAASNRDQASQAGLIALVHPPRRTLPLSHPSAATRCHTMRFLGGVTRIAVQRG